MVLQTDGAQKAKCIDCNKALGFKDRICCLDPYALNDDSGSTKRINLCENCYQKRDAIVDGVNCGDISNAEFDSILNPEPVTTKLGKAAEKKRRKAAKMKANIARKAKFEQRIKDLREDDDCETIETR